MSDLRKADVVNVGEWMKERNQAARDLWTVHMPGFEMIEPGHRDWSYYFQIGDALLNRGYRLTPADSQVERFDEFGTVYPDGRVPRTSWNSSAHDAVQDHLMRVRVHGDAPGTLTLAKRPVRYETGAWEPVTVEQADAISEEATQKLLKGEDE